jgi:hypothetical protein
MTDMQVSLAAGVAPSLSVAIDRSQAQGATINTKLISWGGGSTNATWSALQGAGSEAAGDSDGVMCNFHTGVAWRVLQYSLPIRIAASPTVMGGVGPMSDVFVFDALIASNAALQVDTGVFLMQWAGVAANVVLPSGGAPVGLGFRPNGLAGTIQAWTSVGGAGATSAAKVGGHALRRCLLTITSARGGAPGTYAMQVDGVFLQSGTLNAALGADYTIAGAALAPVVSAGTGAVLFVADFTVLSTPNYL